MITNQLGYELTVIYSPLTWEIIMFTRGSNYSIARAGVNGSRVYRYRNHHHTYHTLVLLVGEPISKVLLHVRTEVEAKD